ncbi:MAG: methyltransferase domain-containing protein [Candidatus Buchananbacteria bacterium]
MVYLTRGKELLDPLAIYQRLGLKAGDRVAHLGCGGAGQFTAPAAQIVGEKSTVYAVDILKPVLQATLSKAMLEGVYNIKAIWSNLEILGATKIPEGSLDYALLINILFQSKKQKEIMAEAKRLLRSGGKLLIIDWNQSQSSFGPPAELKIKPSKVEQFAKELNLNIIDQFQPGTYHFGLILEKP